MTNQKTPSVTAQHLALQTLGAQISLARRQRSLTQADLAKSLGISLMTVRRLEEGYPGTALQYLAMALSHFGVLEQLSTLLAPTGHGNAPTAAVPKRIRKARPASVPAKPLEMFGARSPQLDAGMGA